MVRSLSFIFLLSFLWVLQMPSLPWLSSTAYAFHVSIDPGHGGKDGGATVGKIKEADVVMDISRALKKLIDEDNRISASLTRTDDRFLTLKERVDLAELQEADLIVSIHANSSPDPRAKGVEFFIQNQLSPEEDSLYLAAFEHHHKHYPHEKKPEIEEFSSYPPQVAAILTDVTIQTKVKLSSELSQKLLEEWMGLLKPEAYSIQQAPFYVVQKPKTPAVLVEVGFLTHPKERALLLSPTYQATLASSLYKGLLKFKEFMDKGPVKVLHSKHEKQSKSL